MSNRTDFTIFSRPHEEVNRARKKNPHHPHSVGVLIVTQSGMVLSAESVSAIEHNDYSLTPPQSRFEERRCLADSLRNHGRDLVSHCFADSRIPNGLRYLGTGRGTHRIGNAVHPRMKRIHWYGTVVPGDARGVLVQNSQIKDFANVAFRPVQTFLDLSGQGVSEDKVRMIHQAYLVLGMQQGVYLPGMADVHKSLAEKEQLPKQSAA